MVPKQVLQQRETCRRAPCSADKNSKKEITKKKIYAKDKKLGGMLDQAKHVEKEEAVSPKKKKIQEI